MKFYLGLHQPSDVYAFSGVPFMISVRRLLTRSKCLYDPKKKHPESHRYVFKDFMMDSGGFTELKLNGRYTVSEDTYLQIIQKMKPKVAFCQDWMVEPMILKKTGLGMDEHQHRTVASHLSLAGKLANSSTKMCPVIQGQTTQDYLNHIEKYSAAGVDLEACHLVGIGSMCCRTDLDEIKNILQAIKARIPRARLHGFGMKTTALSDPGVVSLLTSADSMAWSLDARKPKGSKDAKWFPNARNNVHYALHWCRKIERIIQKASSQNWGWPWCAS